MANLKFYGSELSETETTEIQCYSNHGSEIFIEIRYNGDRNNYSYLCLDIPTAIAFRKHLAQQIAKAKEVKNG